MAEYRRADRSSDEADEKHPKRLENADQRRRFRKEELTEDQAGDGAVQQEIVPLDRGSDRAGQQRATQLAVMFGFRQATRGGGERNHLVPPILLWAGTDGLLLCCSRMTIDPEQTQPTSFSHQYQPRSHLHGIGIGRNVL
jgi:hypothetical protein